MGLYNEKIEALKENKKYLIIGISVIILFLVIYLLLSINWSRIGESFKGSNISIQFSRNPFNISKDQELQIMTTIKNDGDIDSENASVSIFPVEQLFYVTCESSLTKNNKVTIPIIAKNASRTISCDIKVSPNINNYEILPGTYSFDVVYNLNNQDFKKRAVLRIKK